MNNNSEDEILVKWKIISRFMGISIAWARKLYKHQGLPVFICNGRAMARKRDILDWLSKNALKK